MDWEAHRRREDLAARRRAEDENVIQEYARGQGHGFDLRQVRAFVRHVRRDLGPKGIIHRVERLTDKEDTVVVVDDIAKLSHHFQVRYSIDGDDPEVPPEPTSVTDVPTHASASVGRDDRSSPGRSAVAMRRSGSPSMVPMGTHAIAAS